MLPEVRLEAPPPMLMLQQQAVLAVPTWAGTVTALSLLVIALSVLALAIGAIRLAFRFAGELEERRALIASLGEDARQTLASVRNLVSNTEHIVEAARDEVGSFQRTSRRVRDKIERGVDRAEERLTDLEALYDVVHHEVEETALDVAAGLRRFRRGRGIAGRMTRFLLRR